MKTKTLLSTVALGVYMSVAAQESQSEWGLHFNSGIASSVLLYQETDESSYRLGAVDPFIGVAWRRTIASRMGVRAGINLRTTTVRYGLEPPASITASSSDGFVMRQRIGVDLPLILDVDLVNAEAKPSLRWLVGAILHGDMQGIEHFGNVSDDFPLADVSEPRLYMGVLTGVELGIALSDAGRLLIAPQVSMGLPNRSPFALSDNAPSASLLTGGLRLTYVPGQRSRLSASDDGPKLNRILVGTGGRSHLRSLHVLYERTVWSHGLLNLMATASAGYGFFGGSSSVGVTASLGGRTHAIDVGMAAGVHLDEATIAPLGEVGYRLSLANGFVGRVTVVHWPVFGNNYLPSMMGVSVGKAF